MNGTTQPALSAKTLRQKVGQMIHCGFHGYEAGEDIARLIRERHIGGVILFARNVRDVRQVAALNANLQRIALEAGLPPLTIAIDQEGGMVARLTEGVALMPGNMAIAAGGEAQAAYDAARVTGDELRALGVNLNYAPVLDVNVNPNNPVIGVRSYGESPELVAEYGVQAVRGLQEAAVSATAKHFPGHGDTDVDSHDYARTGAH
jgi:beta-N-acetylhexosaminidase